MAKKVRVTVLDKGSERSLLSIIERNNGDLTVGMNSSLRTGDEMQGGDEILHEKYSVHTSPASQEFSTLKHTQWLADERKITGYAFTDALKKQSGFSFLFSRQCPDLSNPRYAVSELDQTERVHLAPSPKEFPATLIYSVLAGSVHSIFAPRVNPHFAEIVEVPFTTFKIVILSCYIRVPPDSDSHLFHNITIPPETLEEPEHQAAMRNIMRGNSADECLKIFRNQSSALAIIRIERFLKKLHATGLVDYAEKAVPGLIAQMEKNIRYLRRIQRRSRVGIIRLSGPPGQDRPATPTQK